MLLAVLKIPSFAIFTPNLDTFEGEIFNLSILLEIFLKFLLFELKISALSFETKPIFIPISVNLKSALSDLRVYLYSALEVNIL